MGQKKYAIRIIAFLTNIIEGAAAILAVAVICAFVFEAGNPNHDIGLGLFILLTWLIILLVPNILFKIIGNWRKKDIAVFQIFPLLLGAVSYVAFQIAL